jgi:flagellar L-ring protein precursor FlgH
MQPSSIRRLGARLALVLLLPGCTTVVGPQPGEYPATPPPQPIGDAALDGTVYESRTSLSLFDDVKAGRVGDTITVVLNERTQASKSASTDAKRDSDFDAGTPVLGGGTPTLNGNNILENSWQTSQGFAGDGSSTQSNRLDGSITVTVADVLANGNLVVRGEKWLTLNQGEEFVQIAGIIRPSDIRPDNSVPSFKVADARITYSGSGTIADANKPGVISRLFLKLWPL